MANVSVPAGALITSVVAGLFRFCGSPPFTATETLNAVAGTYFGARTVDELDAEFQCMVNVTGTNPAGLFACGGVPGTEVPPPAQPAAKARMRAAPTGRAKARGQRTSSVGERIRQFPLTRTRRGKTTEGSGKPPPAGTEWHCAPCAAFLVQPDGV